MTLSKAPFAALLLALLLYPLPIAHADSAPNSSSTEFSQQNDDANALAQKRLVDSLRTERAALEARRESLDQKELALKSLQAEVDKKLDELKTLSASLQNLMKQRDAAEEKRVEDLSKMYEKMDPSQAAKILTDLDQNLAIRILSRMRSKAAGAILAAMDQDKAAALSAAFSKVGSP